MNSTMRTRTEESDQPEGRLRLFQISMPDGFFVLLVFARTIRNAINIALAGTDHLEPIFPLFALDVTSSWLTLSDEAADHVRKAIEIGREGLAAYDPDEGFSITDRYL